MYLCSDMLSLLILQVMLKDSANVRRGITVVNFADIFCYFNITVNCYSGNLLVVESGDVYIWGSGSEGQLGMGIDIVKLNKPVMLQMDDRIFQVACGYYHTMLVTGLSSFVLKDLCTLLPYTLMHTTFQSGKFLDYWILLVLLLLV